MCGTIMKMNIVIYVLLVLFSFSAKADSQQAEAHRYGSVGPVYEGFTWACTGTDLNEEQSYIIDVHGNRLTDETFRISNRYFSEGLVTVWKDGKAGCIDMKGQVVIPFVWDDVYSFHHGVAVVERDGKEGLISRTGDILIPCEYKSIEDYYLRKEDSGINIVIAENPRETMYLPITENNVDSVIFANDGRILVISDLVYEKSIYDLTGTKQATVDSIVDMYNAPLDSGLLTIKDENGFGYLDRNGRIAIPCQYLRANHFSEGLAAVLSKGADHFSIIDTQGNVLVDLPAGYYIENRCSEGLFVTTDSHGLFGYFDINGKLVIPCQWVIAGDFSEGLAIVKKDGYYGVIDKHGTIVVPCERDYISTFNDGHAKVQKKDAWGLISYEGELTVPCVFDYLNYNKDGVYYFEQTIENEHKYGLIDNHGVILSPAQWDYMSYLLTNDIIEVIQTAESEGENAEYKIGYIDLTGSIIVPCEYDSGYYREGFFTLIKDGYLTILDKQGNTVF